MTLHFFKPLHSLVILYAFLGFLLSGSSVLAQTLPCGNIIAPGDWETDLWLENPIESVPIIDCNLPFGEVDEWGEGERKLVFSIEESLVNNGDVFTVLDGRTKTYDFEYNFLSPNSVYGHVIFRHENNNYEFVDSRVVPLTESDYRELAIEFGVIEEDIEEYVARKMSDDPYEGLVYGTPEYERFDEFDIFTYSAAEKNYPYLESGTYTIVYHFYEQESAWDEPYLASRHADTFTVTGVEVEPTGASSVLFLPGIQASRLYTERDSGSEDRLWEPNADADVEYLEMTENGESVNDIYTRDVLDEIALPFFGQNIYKGFLGMLEELVDDNVIQDYEAFAYDWRYSVVDVVLNGTKYEDEVRSVIAKVEELAEGSYSGKVTVIGHSNGGLVAKMLISELERQGKADLVDKVVFIGTPQLGTPKAIGVMLHGMKQQKVLGLIVDDMTARDVVRNMPGVYGLLPSPRYFDVSGDVLVTSDNTESTANIREYGDIDSYEKLTAFLLDSNNVRSDEVSINTPGTLNSSIINDTASLREGLDNWLAPDTVEVYEIVGTGLATIKGFEYKQFPCASAICAFGNYSKAFPLITHAGDETVMELSADAYTGSKVKGVINLKEEGDGVLSFDREHADMAESPTVQSFVDSIIRFPYLNETIEVPQQFIDVGTYTMIGSHSPVEMNLETTDGDRVGMFDGVQYEEVPGSQYFELGGSSYIVIPKEVEYEVTIKGTDTGVYSLTIDTLDESDIQSNEFTYLGASTTPQMVAVFSASSTGFSTIKTDQDGDGVFDKEQTLDGNPVVEEGIYTFDSLISEIKLLELKKVYKNILLIQVKLAKHQMERGKTRLASVTLYNLERTLKLYKAKKLIEAKEFELLVQIITQLKK